jgi:ATP-dependent RNA helicase SUPV3L1/SUV3
VLERSRVAEEVKGLEQAARATLRKYGVRFGAYHLYLPNLLKPGRARACVQLWALKEATPETKGLDEVPHLASSGRTSFQADKDVPKALYRVVGYRVCGERAVRVDILERLADLIRPALAWRPGRRAEAAGRGRGRRLHRDGEHDVAHRLVGRGLRLDAALARLPDGQAVEARRAGAGAERGAEPAPNGTAGEAAPPRQRSRPSRAAESRTARRAERRIERAPAMPRVVPEVGRRRAAGARRLPPSLRSKPKPEEKPAEPEMIEVWRPGRPPEEAPSAASARRAARTARAPSASRRPRAAGPQAPRRRTAPHRPSGCVRGAERSEADEPPRHGRDRPNARIVRSARAGRRSASAAAGAGSRAAGSRVRAREGGATSRIATASRAVDRSERRRGAADPNSAVRQAGWRS